MTTVIVGMTAIPTLPEENTMNRTLKALAATLMTLGLVVVGLPLGGGDAVVNVGSTGCCRQ